MRTISRVRSEVSTLDTATTTVAGESVVDLTSLALEEVEQEARSSVNRAHKSFRFGAIVNIVTVLTSDCNKIVT